MNAMLYIRGVPLDYDEWREAGCVGWGWQDVLPYFKKSERNLRFNDELHGQDGPLTVADRVSDNGIVNAFVAAAQSAGYPYNDDFNGPSQDGVGYFQLTQQNVTRLATSAAYLRPAMRCENIKVETEMQVRRILLEGRRAVARASRPNAMARSSPFVQTAKW